MGLGLLLTLNTHKGMSKPKRVFKVGDKVTYRKDLSKFHYGGFEPSFSGFIGEVLSFSTEFDYVEGKGHTIIVSTPKGLKYTMMESEFEEYKQPDPSPAPAPHKFKIGDKVCCVEKGRYGSTRYHRECTVTNISPFEVKVPESATSYEVDPSIFENYSTVMKKEALRRYPKGTVYKSAMKGGGICTVHDPTKFIHSRDGDNIVGNAGEGHIRYEGVWAEILEKDIYKKPCNTTTISKQGDKVKSNKYTSPIVLELIEVKNYKL